MLTFIDQFFVIHDCALRSQIGVREVIGGIFHHKRAPEFEVQVNAVDTRNLWHKRLGHPSSQVFNIASSSLSINGSFENKSKEPCDVLFRAKQTCCQLYDSESNASKVFGLTHCDIWGAYGTPSLCVAHYFLTIVDDVSWGVRVYLMREKEKLKEIVATFYYHGEKSTRTRC